jgi:hypothetical protein
MPDREFLHPYEVRSTVEEVGFNKVAVFCLDSDGTWYELPAQGVQAVFQDGF